jgi:uncharacterized protein YifE (UPF0438 family)
VPLAFYTPDIFERYFVRRFRNAENDLTSRERKSLEKHGTRLEALKEGRLRPQTEEERHFLSVCDGVDKPIKVYERAWIKYQSLCASEPVAEESRREKFRHSAEYAERLQSRLSASKHDEVLLSQQVSDDKRLKKCTACGGAVYDCWKCNGRGWTEIR